MSEPTVNATPRTDKMARIIRFTAYRYNRTNNPDHPLALGYAAIMIQVRELRLSSADPERALLDWLSKPHAEPGLLRACKTVFEMLSSA